MWGEALSFFSIYGLTLSIGGNILTTIIFVVRVFVCNPNVNYKAVINTGNKGVVVWSSSVNQKKTKL